MTTLVTLLFSLSLSSTPQPLGVGDTCVLSDSIKVFQTQKLKTAKKRLQAGEGTTILKQTKGRFRIKSGQVKGWVKAGYFKSICHPPSTPEPTPEPIKPEPQPAPALAPETPKATAPPEVAPAPAPAPPAEAKPERVLLLDAEAPEALSHLGKIVETTIAEICEGRDELELVTTSDLETIVSNEQVKQAFGCESNVSCMAEVSQWANTENVLKATLGKVGDVLTLTLSLIDAKRAQVMERVQQEFRQEEELPQAAKQALFEIFSLEGQGNVVKYRLTEGQKVTLAVLELKTAGLSESVAQNLTQVLSVELKRIDGASVISSDDIEAMLSLEQDKQMLGCDSDTACLAAIGGALGVDKLVVGQVGMLGSSYLISLKLIDPMGAGVDNRINETFRGAESTLMHAIRSAGRRLLGVEINDPGSLTVTSSQQAATLLLNGDEKGLLPLPPINDLTPGRHSIRIQKDGFIPWSGDIYINPFETTSHWVELEEAPQRWYQKWWVWTIAGTAVAGVATTMAIVLQEPSQTVEPVLTVR